MSRIAAVAMVPVLILTGLAAGCERDKRPVIQVDPRVALADEAVHIRITGLVAGTTVELGAQARDYAGTLWSSRANFVADHDGVVDLDRDAPSEGYSGVDGMGLFSSMTLASDGDKRASTDTSGYAPKFPELKRLKGRGLMAGPGR
ncbi:acyl-CoA thioesterase/BAAT N-terminal domain-containing protein [Streptosporangiaceae bacterium NEAU-GS5]|nr:acyl-CoA thioesterase/BAAT N-terminal domain-containing protein [Streptosporangiaceae bacterium NEAU-GS5]